MIGTFTVNFDNEQMESLVTLIQQMSEKVDSLEREIVELKAKHEDDGK